MGGVVFILATRASPTSAGHFVLATLPDGAAAPDRPDHHRRGAARPVRLHSALVGFLDDFLKVRKRNSLGLNKRGKLIGQTLVGAVFGVIAL